MIRNTHPGSLDAVATTDRKATSQVQAIPKCQDCGREMFWPAKDGKSWVCLCKAKVGRAETV